MENSKHHQQQQQQRNSCNIYTIYNNSNSNNQDNQKATFHCFTRDSSPLLDPASCSVPPKSSVPVPRRQVVWSEVKSKAPVEEEAPRCLVLAAEDSEAGDGDTSKFDRKTMGKCPEIGKNWCLKPLKPTEALKFDGFL